MNHQKLLDLIQTQFNSYCDSNYHNFSDKHDGNYDDETRLNNIYITNSEIETKITKDKIKSEQLRLEANKLFSHGHYEKAQNLYSKALRYAFSFEDQSQIYANRSASSFELGQYLECILDTFHCTFTYSSSSTFNTFNHINFQYTVTMLGKHKIMMFKVFRRRALSYENLILSNDQQKIKHGCSVQENLSVFDPRLNSKNLDQNSELMSLLAKEAIEMSLSILQSTDIDLTLQQKESWQSKIEHDLNRISTNLNCSCNLFQNDVLITGQKESEIDEFLSPGIPTCTEVSTKLYPKKGRSILATKKMKKGSTVLLEHPYLSVVHDEFLESICSSCLKHNSFMIPCPYCCLVMYCDEDCKNTYWIKGGHQMECQSVLSGSVPLDLRLALRVNLESNSEIESLVDHLQAYTEKEIYDNFIHGMFETIKFPNMELKENKNMNDKILVFYKNLVLNRLRIRHNAMGIPLTTTSSSDKSNAVSSSPTCLIQETNVITCVFLKGSLLNHSCSPNALACFIKNDHQDTMYLVSDASTSSRDYTIRPSKGSNIYLCVQTLRNIEEGEEICISYGPMYPNSSRVQRQKQLAMKWRFECSCQLCSMDEKLEKDVNKYKCVRCGNGLSKKESSCIRCGDVLDMDRVSNIHLRILELERDLCHEHSMRIGKRCHTIAQHYADSGQLELSLNYLKQSIQILKFIYDGLEEYGIEIGRELIQLVQIQQASGLTKEAIKRANEALSLLQPLVIHDVNENWIDVRVKQDVEFLRKIISM